ncbi:hypothetical protein PENTCL1PPCAC_26200, partial [Pristionchus entomophagus]
RPLLRLQPHPFRHFKPHRVLRMVSSSILVSVVLSFVVAFVSSSDSGLDDGESLMIEGMYPSYEDYHLQDKRDSMPGVLRFGKRAQAFVRFGKRLSPIEKKEMPGVLRFGKRNEKKSVPGVLRFGKRSSGMESEMEGLIFKKSVPGVLRFGRK